MAKGKPGKDTKGGRYGIEDEFGRVGRALEAASNSVDLSTSLPEHLVKLEAGKSLTRKSWPAKWNGAKGWVASPP